MSVGDVLDVLHQMYVNNLDDTKEHEELVKQLHIYVNHTIEQRVLSGEHTYTGYNDCELYWTTIVGGDHE